MNELTANLTAKQTKAWHILENESKTEVLFDGGVRAGKTFIIILWLIVFCLKVKGAYILIGRRFFEHCRKSLYIQTIEPLLSNFPSTLWNINKQDWIIHFQGGSQLWLGGFDDSKRVTEIMGREYLYAFLNEATEIEEAMVDKVKTRLAQKVKKSKNTFYRPRLFFDCNPGHPEFYLNKRFNNGGNNKARLSWSLYDNRDNLTSDYIKELEDSLPPLEKERLIKGLWVGAGDYVYGNINEDIVIDSYEQQEYQYLIAGIDWGYISAFNLWRVKDNVAACIAEVETKGKITSEFLEEVQNIMKALEINYRSFPVYCDHEPDRIEEANRMGFNAKKAYKDVAAGDNSVNWFDVRILNDCPATYKSLRYLENAKDKNGDIVEGKHLKINDHCADATRYCLHSFRMDYAQSETVYQSVSKRRFAVGRGTW